MSIWLLLKIKLLASVTSSTQVSNSLEGQCQRRFLELYRIKKREGVTTRVDEVDQLYYDCSYLAE